MLVNKTGEVGGNSEVLYVRVRAHSPSLKQGDSNEMSKKGSSVLERGLFPLHFVFQIRDGFLTC